MSDCEVCGGDMVWNGGIVASTCVLEQHPLCHMRAGKARKYGVREERERIRAIVEAHRTQPCPGTWFHKMLTTILEEIDEKKE